MSPGRRGPAARRRRRPVRPSGPGPRTEYLRASAPKWTAALKDGDPLVRRLAAYALGEIGAGLPKPAVAALVGGLEDEAAFVRVWAAAALGRAQPANRRVIPALVAAMHDEAAFVRSLGAWHLGRIGPELAGVERALPVLEGLLADPDASVRTEAAVALRSLRTASLRQRG